MLNDQDHKQAKIETRLTANKRGFRPTFGFLATFGDVIGGQGYAVHVSRETRTATHKHLPRVHASRLRLDRAVMRPEGLHRLVRAHADLEPGPVLHGEPAGSGG